MAEDQDMSDEKENNDVKISIEYTPLELTGLLQILDYIDVDMLQSGVPLGIVSQNRKKIYDAMLKSDIQDGLEDERRQKREEYGEMFGKNDEVDFPNRSGFQ